MLLSIAVLSVTFQDTPAFQKTPNALCSRMGKLRQVTARRDSGPAKPFRCPVGTVNVHTSYFGVDVLL